MGTPQQITSWEDVPGQARQRELELIVPTQGRPDIRHINFVVLEDTTCTWLASTTIVINCIYVVKYA